MSHSETHTSDLGFEKKTFEIYLAGIIACVFLTLIPFAAVMWPVLSTATTAGLVVSCALAQFVVQVVCFLRLNYHSEQSRTNTQSFILFMMIVFIIVAGSLWIMWSLDARMM